MNTFQVDSQKQEHVDAFFKKLLPWRGDEALGDYCTLRAAFKQLDICNTVRVELVITFKLHFTAQ